MTQKQRMDNESQDKILVRDLNVVITCRLCEGYLIDATTLVDCFHVFCRGCILRYFENNKTGCPTCNTVYKKKTQACFRPDPQIQALVYKLVPSLYAKEMQRREDFYRSTGVRASSSCSDDSVIERERDMINDHEEMISTYVGDKTLFLSPEDSISLSLEYYQLHLDTTDMKGNKNHASTPVETPSESDIKNTDISDRSIRNIDETQTSLSENADSKSDKDKECAKQTETETNVVDNAIDSDKKLKQEKECDKRFLQCPAAVLMKHLQKFVRLKYGLTGDHRVDIIYKGEVLPHNFSLMDVAYTFKWKRVKPMRFFYRIFIPMKIRPIKIVNTTLSTGGKQLQIVPVKPNMEAPKTPERREKTPEKKDKTPERKNRSPEIREEVKEEKPKETESKFLEETEDQKHNKERLFAHLQLQSKSQIEKESKKVPDKLPHKDCVFEYEEPDQEEIKKFAEKRDREWALQKKLDEKRKVDQFGIPHVSKKRKKSKHSKNEFNLHKKRKLHAEIASNEEELKLKVKITNNGHKHKHHKSSGQVNEKSHTSSVSSKEKLLQMRQVRHKHSPEDKVIQTGPMVQVSNEADTNVEKIRINVSDNSITEKRKENGEETKPSPNKLEDIKKLKIKVSEPSSVVTESAVLPKQQTDSTSTSPKVGTLLEQSSSKPVFSIRSPIESREWGKKVPNVNMERTEQSSKQAQKTFLKTFHAYAEKYYKNEKIQQTKMENAKIKQMNLNKMQQIKTDKINSANKNLERKISSSLQIAANTPKPSEKVDKKVTFVNDKTKMPTPHYPPGFTVSKIEQGVKRKVEDGDNTQDKRPSLEITLITPPSTSPIQQTPKPEKHAVKRPPPATIPLERIKKSVNLKSGISIIPKLPDMCDNIGALDLSKPSKSSDAPKAPAKLQNTNGFSITNRQINALSRLPASAPEKSNMALSNLQMLSKVATEHSTLNNKTPGQNNVAQNKPRPQMPNLQTLKIPSLPIRPNLQKIPKLNEINKFRPTNPQIRNLRPNQNQNIRNIPNPSLLNQNRLNSQISIHTNSDSAVPKSTPSVTVTSSQPVQKETATMTAVKSIIEPKVQETKEISV